MNNQIIDLNPADRYRPGGSIIGKVAFHLDRREYLRGVNIELKGKESTEWSEELTYHDRTNNSVRQGPITYYGINRVTPIAQNLRGPGIEGPGFYEYPFEIYLPTFLPNTYKGNHGKIVYYLKATVELTDGMILFREAIDVVIHGYINLFNLRNYNLEPLHLHDENMPVTCCTLSTGLAALDLSLVKQFYTLDETITPSICINNKSGADIHSVYVELSKVIMEKVKTPETKTKYDRKVVDSKRGAGVPSGTKNSYSFSFQIGTSINALNNFGNAKLFKELFILRVLAPLGDNEPLKVETQLIIGHINSPTSQVDVNGDTIDHMNVPGGTPYPPLPDHMSIPGRTPYPPPLAISPPLPIDPLGQNQPVVPSRITQEEALEDPPPSYYEVISNPRLYSSNLNN